MSSEWPTAYLKDLADEVTVGFVGSMATEYIDKGIPFLRSLNVSPFEINTNDLKYISEEFHNRLKKSSLKPGDVVIVRTGKPGTCSVIPDWLDNANCSDLVIVRCGPRIRPHFLSYFVNSIASAHISAHLVGAVQQHFNVGAAKKMLVSIPSLQIQDQILTILRAMDNRIALLRETNATLEAIAQALFKSWFVDFDPVHANAGTQAPSLPAEIQALFPSRLAESPQGLIPEGWEVGCLSDLCSISSGKRPEIRSDNPGDSTSVPLYGGAGIMGYTNRTLFDGKKILTGRVGTLGKVHIATPPFWASDNVLVLTPKSDDYFYFSLNWLKAIDVHSLNRGSTQPLLTQKDLGAQLRAIPPKNICGEFDKVVLNIYLKIESNNTQADSLSNLRDTLLPRLISGQMRLPEAEAELSEILA